LFARYSGQLAASVRGARALAELRGGDRVLVSEGCTHCRKCDDIGTVKMPRWVRAHAGADDLHFSFTSGRDYPEDLTPFKLVIHCGGCMLNAREIASRALRAARQGVPFVNYGIAIAHMHGVLDRCLSALRLTPSNS
jgi:hypothetical protein